MADVKALKKPLKRRGDYTFATAATTLKDSDSGKIFGWNHATSFNFTLPPVKKTSKGVFFDFVVMTAATSGTGHGVSPNAVDKVFTPGATATDDKDVYFATAGDAVGNGFRLTSDGKDGWLLTHLHGTLSQEA